MYYHLLLYVHNFGFANNQRFLRLIFKQPHSEYSNGRSDANERQWYVTARKNIVVMQVHDRTERRRATLW